MPTFGDKIPVYCLGDYYNEISYNENFFKNSYKRNAVRMRKVRFLLVYRSVCIRTHSVVSSLFESKCPWRVHLSIGSEVLMVSKMTYRCDLIKKSESVCHVYLNLSVSKFLLCFMFVLGTWRSMFVFEYEKKEITLKNDISSCYILSYFFHSQFRFHMWRLSLPKQEVPTFPDHPVSLPWCI